MSVMGQCTSKRRHIEHPHWGWALKPMIFVSLDFGGVNHFLGIFARRRVVLEYKPTGPTQPSKHRGHHPLRIEG